MKDPWLVCRFTGRTNHVAQDPDSGRPLFNLDEDTATKVVAECTQRDPDQIFEKLAYPPGELESILNQHHLDLG